MWPKSLKVYPVFTMREIENHCLKSMNIRKKDPKIRYLGITLYKKHLKSETTFINK